MNTPHTPGPWRPFVRYVLCNGRFLATAHAIGDTGHGAGFKAGQEPMQDMNEAIANAQLLASAPTLLSQRNELREALELALPYVEMAEHDDSYKKGAVAKAVTAIRSAIFNSTKP